MKVALVAPTGNIGSHIAKELLANGHEVIGIVRSEKAVPAELAGVSFKVVDIADTTAFAAAIAGVDALASAYGPALDNIDSVGLVVEQLVAAAKVAGVKRLIVVGGAGSLEVATGMQLVDSPDFPDAYKPYALAHRKAFNYLQTVNDLDWTFFSPAAEIGPGEKLGGFTVQEKRFLANAKGESRIHYPDYATAFVSELVAKQHLKTIITVAYQ